MEERVHKDGDLKINTEKPELTFCRSPRVKSKYLLTRAGIPSCSGPWIPGASLERWVSSRVTPSTALRERLRDPARG